MRELTLNSLAINEDGGGHRVININHKTVYLHRYIMELYLGRKLDSNEIVHHKNAKQGDNRLENLILMDRKEHAKYHAHKRMIDRSAEMRECLKENKKRI